MSDARRLLLHRPQDMLFVPVDLVNLTQRRGRLVVEDQARPGLVVFHLPPQHVAEVSADTVADAAPGRAAWSSGSTTLAFTVPPGRPGVGFDVGDLLDWAALGLRCLPPGGKPDDDDPRALDGQPVTAIEFPTRLLLTPEGPVAWTSHAAPVDLDGRTELWHTFLKAEDGGDLSLRAFAVPPGRPDHGEPLLPLKPQDLQDIVTLTTATDIADYVPVPLIAHRFLLTPLGATVELGGVWDDPALDRAVEQGRPLGNLRGYQHTSGLGRDQLVRLVKVGRLCTGHRATVVDTYERRFETSPDGTSTVAYLRKRTYVTVREPEVRYDAAAVGYENDGRDMPFTSLRITDTRTPEVAGVDSSRPFVVPVDNAMSPYRFTLIGTDREGRRVTLRAPLVFYPDNVTGQDAINDYQGRDAALRTADLAGQVVALAQPPGEAAGATALPVTSLVLTLAKAPKHPLKALPVMAGAKVRVPALEHVTNTGGETMVALATPYVQQGPGARPGGSFLSVVDEHLKPADLPLAFGPQNVGGLARPDVRINEITSLAGPLPGAMTGVQDAVPADLKKAFGDARLLGTVSLGDLLGPVPPFDPAKVRDLADDQVENLLASAGLPVPVLRSFEDPATLKRVVRYLWTPKLQNVGDLGFIDVSKATLALEARTEVSPDGLAASQVTGLLKNLKLDFAGMIGVSAEKLSFVSRPGSKPDVSASGIEMSFQGALEFVNDLREVLPKDGFGSGAFVDVSPRGIRAGYSLALPPLAIGVFSLTNMVLAAELSVPFDDEPFRFRFALSERHKPFNVSIAPFSGGGFLAITVRGDKPELIEGALEFGGSAAINLGIAEGGVSLMAGIYFALGPDKVLISGYVRCSGHLSVLGIVTVSVEFYLALSYEKISEGGKKFPEVYGEGTLTVSVRIAFFSKSVSLHLERRFRGDEGDPPFSQFVGPDDWNQYCLAFAA
ncbi:hypothetical protein [Streptomyces millisiae]|uniref:Uncharacterized protein n=1 Tax=Streptomyces millisiae TaxID=3075542 RepID=A0ABU2LJF1_9ACTN|nr:hypothetical protein [Streptomyces sp. DSM 44918]MDT0317615.1 hypothetical protein [Streptomyces sp. DSM 44918]